MARLRRKGRILRWTGLVLSSVFVVTWVVSIPWSWDYFRRDTQSGVDPASGQPVVDHYTFILSLSRGSVFHFRDRGTDSYPEILIWRIRLDPARPVWMPYWKRGLSGTRSLVLPLWIPLLLIAMPTLYLWWVDRRIPPGHCSKCGYNLAGNVSGICPECGEKVNAEVVPKG